MQSVKEISASKNINLLTYKAAAIIGFLCITASYYAAGEGRGEKRKAKRG